MGEGEEEEEEEEESIQEAAGRQHTNLGVVEALGFFTLAWLFGVLWAGLECDGVEVEMSAD